MRLSMLLVLFFELPFASPIILSEIMANPEAVLDSHGEFLELANRSEDSLRVDSLTVIVDGAAYRLHNLFFLPHDHLVICRDSLISENGGLICGQTFTNLSLTNSRPLSISLQVNNEAATSYSIPASRVGVSWENTFDKEKNFQNFSASNHFWQGKDSATPGTRNSQSLELPKCDLGITEASFEPLGNLHIAVENFGSAKAPPRFLVVTLDEDWDGVAESVLDSVEIDMENLNQKIISIHIGNRIRGWVHLELSYDDNTRNNFFLVNCESSTIIRVTEWCPAPDTGAAEWVEIQNTSSDSGEVGQKIYLSNVQLNGVLITTKKEVLEPGEYVIVTQSLSHFQKQFGSLKVRAIEISPWPTLKNSGDTVKLSSQGMVLDQAVFGKVSTIEKGQCFTKNNVNRVMSATNTSTTPGFTGIEPEEFSWTFSGKKVNLENPVQISVHAPAGFIYTLRVFDLEGNKIIELGQGSQGKNQFIWNGISANGNQVSAGPYLVSLNSSGHMTRRQVVIVK